MKRFLSLAFLFTAVLTFGADGLAQAPQIKTIISRDPVFPAEAKNYIYGESVKVAVNVDKKGRVAAAHAFGPLAPCSNLNDPVARSIREAALDAAKAAVFEPILDDGKPVERGLVFTYRLRPADGAPPVAQETTLTGDAVKSKPLSLPKPRFSETAKANRIGGTVQIAILIAEDGTVISAGAISGHPALIEGNLKTACASRHAPATQAGQPIKVMSIITYTFVP